MITDSHRVGLVGKNGTGKTTFLKILKGELRGDLGKVTIDPAKAKIVYHRQVIDTDITPENKDDAELAELKSAEFQNFTTMSYLLNQNEELFSIWKKLNAEDAELDYTALIEEYTEKAGYDFENKIVRALKRLKLDSQAQVKAFLADKKLVCNLQSY